MGNCCILPQKFESCHSSPSKKKASAQKKPSGGWLKRREGDFGFTGTGKKIKKSLPLQLLHAIGRAKGRAKKGLMQKNFFGVPPPKKVTLQAKKKGALFHFRSWFLEKKWLTPPKRKKIFRAEVSHLLLFLKKCIWMTPPDDRGDADGDGR